MRWLPCKPYRCVPNASPAMLACGSRSPAPAWPSGRGRPKHDIDPKGGPICIDVPRNRDSSFEPVLIPKHERRFTGFDEKIVGMYARGMTAREIQGFLLEQYGT